jgi:hypothetical protein
VGDQGRDTRGVRDHQDERERKTHRDAHGGVTAQFQQPGRGDPP